MPFSRRHMFYDCPWAPHVSLLSGRASHVPPLILHLSCCKKPIFSSRAFFFRSRKISRVYLPMHNAHRTSEDSGANPRGVSPCVVAIPGKFGSQGASVRPLDKSHRGKVAAAGTWWQLLLSWAMQVLLLKNLSCLRGQLEKINVILALTRSQRLNKLIAKKIF